MVFSRLAWVDIGTTEFQERIDPALRDRFPDERFDCSGPMRRIFGSFQLVFLEKTSLVIVLTKTEFPISTGKVGLPVPFADESHLPPSPIRLRGLK